MEIRIGNRIMDRWGRRWLVVGFRYGAVLVALNTWIHRANIVAAY